MNEKQLLIDLGNKLLPSEIRGMVERIELESWKKGMTEAAEIVDRARLYAIDQQWPHTVQDMTRLHTIITTERDNKR